MPFLLFIIVAAAAAMAMRKKPDAAALPSTPKPDDASAIGSPSKGRTLGSFFTSTNFAGAKVKQYGVDSSSLPSYLPESTKKPPFATPGPGEHGIIRADVAIVGAGIMYYYLGKPPGYQTPGPLGASYYPGQNTRAALEKPIAKDIIALNPHLIEMGYQVEPSSVNDADAWLAGLAVISEQHHYLVIPRTWQPFMRKEPIYKTNYTVKSSNHYPISVPPVLEFDGNVPNAITMAQLRARLKGLKAEDS